MTENVDNLDALKYALSRVDELSGCADNSCLFKKPIGMGTNGGCRCLGRGDSKPGLNVALANLFLAAKMTCGQKDDE